MASISEFYSRNLATEVRKGFEQKVKAGGTPTRAKLGYLNAREVTPDGRNIGVIKVDPERAPLIRLAIELYATGDFSFRALCDVLAASGLRTRPTRRHQGLPLTTSQIDRILKDPYYIGIVRYKGVDYEGAHEPLISPELFQRVQDIITAHAVSGDKRRLHHHWLKGTMFCGACGKRLIFARAKNRHGRTYEYFYCVGRQHYDRSCQQGWLPVDAVEEAVIAQYPDDSAFAAADREKSALCCVVLRSPTLNPQIGHFGALGWFVLSRDVTVCCCHRVAEPRAPRRPRKRGSSSHDVALSNSRGTHFIALPPIPRLTSV